MYHRRMIFRAAAACGLFASPAKAFMRPLERIVVSSDKRGFETEMGVKRFIPWGFNYDHDEAGRLIEDYWHDQWSSVVEDFQEIRDLGANVVRVHLQFGKFMESKERPNRKNLDQLSKLVELAEATGLYLNITGLGCYHKQDVPAWYDLLDEKSRWEAQASFWRAVAGECRSSNAIFCYDIMNEPVVPGGRRKAGDWLGPGFGDKYFVQMITLDQEKRPRFEIARAWCEQMTKEIRTVDERHLITLGLVDWSLDRPGLTSGFIPEKTCHLLDFLSVHIYPEKAKNGEALKTLSGFQMGKPVVIEETFSLKCGAQQWREFVESSKRDASGWFGFYWGKTLGELKDTKSIRDAILLEWLNEFQKGSPK